MEEQWRPIPGYSRYECSNTGQIRNAKGRILTPHVASRTGYRIVTIHPDDREQFRTVMVPALVARTWLGPRPEGFQIDHKDGNKTNDVITNLEFVSQEENIQRSYDNGQHPYRPDYHNYLSEEQYEAIRALWRTGQYSQVRIGKIIGVDNSTISKIVNGKTSPRISMKSVRLGQIQELLAQGWGKRRISRHLGIHISSVVWYIRQLARVGT